jgi:hypothetical protein
VVPELGRRVAAIVAAKKSSGKAGGKKNCTKGWPCKGTCISQSKKCGSTVKGQPATTYQQWLGSQSSATGVSSSAATSKPSSLSPAVKAAVSQASQKIAQGLSLTGSSGSQASKPYTNSQLKKLSLANLLQTANDLGVAPQLQGVKGTAAQKALLITVIHQAQGTTAPTPKSTPSSQVAPATNNATPFKRTKALPTNQAELDRRRNQLIQDFGQEKVDAAEKNLKQVIAKAGVYKQVGSNQTIEAILDGGTKNAFELGTTDHDIPYLLDTNYLSARRRVEAKVMGIDPNTADSDRPEYLYLGSPKAPKGAVHDTVSDAYGSIAIKFKDAVKDDATVSGSDSFKDGIASPARDPKATSAVNFTRHGYDTDDLPGHYPYDYGYSKTEGRARLDIAGTQKNLDRLSASLSPSGNAYMELQVHRKLGPADIESLHYDRSKGAGLPSGKVLQWAKTNNVPVYVDGHLYTEGAKVHPALKKLGITDPDNVNNLHYDRSDYKPLMTEAEATQYTANSAYAGKEFYHGSNDAAVKSITTQGVDISANRVAAYGGGFYLAEKFSEAEGYAEASTGITGKAQVISARIDVRNPLKVVFVKYFYGPNSNATVATIKGDPNYNQLPVSLQKKMTANADKDDVRRAVMLLGYDAIEVDFGRGSYTGNYFIIMNSQQFAAYAKDDV